MRLKTLSPNFLPVFYKYQATGNDFVLFDNRDSQILPDQPDEFALLCHRRFGVGADGVILLTQKVGYDFEMQYYNADGKPGTMCGNGGRAAVKFAQFLGLIEKQTTFWAPDGLHSALVSGETVELKMGAVGGFRSIENKHGHYFLDTGSPHYVVFSNEPIDRLDVETEGRRIRYNDEFKAKGVNVNFVHVLGDNRLAIRTYERGVEAETYSCGTGATATAIAFSKRTNRWGETFLETLGGILSVKADILLNEVWLCGGAEPVFKGELAN